MHGSYCYGSLTHHCSFHKSNKGLYLRLGESVKHLPVVADQLGHHGGRPLSQLILKPSNLKLEPRNIIVHSWIYMSITYVERIILALLDC